MVRNQEPRNPDVVRIHMLSYEDYSQQRHRPGPAVWYFFAQTLCILLYGCTTTAFALDTQDEANRVFLVLHLFFLFDAILLHNGHHHRELNFPRCYILLHNIASLISLIIYFKGALTNLLVLPSHVLLMFLYMLYIVHENRHRRFTGYY